jgi:predicted esterase
VGADVERIDEALVRVFASYPIDPTHLAIGGFSDGASYALSLGVMNGDLFGAVIAWSPGFIAPKSVTERKPRIFLSHGTKDTILPIDHCGRPIAHSLHQNGYKVEYIEFDGGHEMPDPIIRASFSWLVDG